MKKIALKILISFSFLLLSPLSLASNLSEEVFNQSCKACANCCSTYDNVEMVETTNVKKSKKKARTKKKQTKRKKTRTTRKLKKAKTSKKARRTKKARSKKARTSKRTRKAVKPRKVKKTKKVNKAKKLVSVTPAKAVKKAVVNNAATRKNNKWLTKKLYGSSLATSALSPMTSYTNEKNELRVVINSLFTFDCGLQFDNRAQPSLLSGCLVKTENNQWKVKEKNIVLNCSSTDISHTCKGNYTLMLSNNDDKNEAHKMTIAIRK